MSENNVNLDGLNEIPNTPLTEEQALEMITRGGTPEEIAEALPHTAEYLGIPVTNSEEIVVEQTFEKNQQVADLDAEGIEGAEPKEFPKINYRHPHQVLSNKEMQLLLLTPEEQRSENDKLALNMLKLRLKFHGSRPRKTLSTEQRAKKRAKRKTAKASRKTNR